MDLDAFVAREARLLRDRTPRSHAMHQRALHTMPEGVPSSLAACDPYPLVVGSASGAVLTDVDGHDYLDFHLGFAVNLTGHAHPGVLEVITRQSARAIHTGTASVESVLLAEHLCLRFGVEQVCFTNSGTESTQLAIRIARAVTGRPGVVKMEGGYHGTHDSVMVSTHPALRDVGARRRPRAVPWGEGASAGARADTHVIPFNDLDALVDVLVEEQPACVIVEPIMLNVGFIAPEPGYLARLREMCREAGVLCIVDEVKTGLTTAWGGARERYGLEGDLVCLGKGIAGGLPLGAVAGRAELLSAVSDGRAPHYSTFAGGPLACAVAHHVCTEVLTPDTYRRLSGLAEDLVGGAQAALTRHGISGYVAAAGLKGAIHLAEGPPFRDYRDYESRTDFGLALAIWLGLLNRGIVRSPHQDDQITLSVAHTRTEVDAFLAAYEDVCAAITAS